MTTATTDPIRPLARARAGGFGLDIRVVPPPADEPGWRPADAVARQPRRLEVLLDRTATAAGTTSRAVAATWHLEKHAWHVASASLAAILVHGTMPPLEQAVLRDAEEGWPDAIAVPPSDWTPANGATLAARLEAHLEPLVDALCHHRPAGALWRSVSDRLGQAALWCGEAFTDHRRAWTLAGEAMTAPTALAAPTGFDLVDGVPFRRRTGCCLSHRCQPALICDDCRLRR
jgi:hypothetical protein